MKACLIVIILTTKLIFWMSMSGYNEKLYGNFNYRDIDTLSVSGDSYRIQWLLKENFEDNQGLKNWVLETTEADIQIKEGKLFMSDYGVGTTLWHTKEFPKDIIIRYVVQSEKGASENKLNFNTISHARENDGSPLKIGQEAKRTGAYVQYHQFKNYISTLTFKHSRLRKNPDFTLLSDSDVCSVEDQIYEIVCTVQEGRIRYYLNNVKIHDFQDVEPLEGGKFALRTWSTKASWDKVEIGQLIK